MSEVFTIDTLLREYSHVSHIFKFGANDAVGTSYEVIEFAGTTTYRTSEDTVQVSSSSANDTSAGTGAQTVTIQGVNGNYVEESETITMNGQTAVESSKRYIRVHRAFVETVGSNGTNVGDVYVHDDDTLTAGVPDANIFLQIGADLGQSLIASYTVPANKTAYLSSFNASSFGNANQYAIVELRQRPNGGAWRVQDRVYVSRGSIRIPHDTLIKYPEKTDIQVRAIGSAAIDVTASFELLMV